MDTWRDPRRFVPFRGLQDLPDQDPSGCVRMNLLGAQSTLPANSMEGAMALGAARHLPQLASVNPPFLIVSEEALECS